MDILFSCSYLTLKNGDYMKKRADIAVYDADYVLQLVVEIKIPHHRKIHTRSRIRFRKSPAISASSPNSGLRSSSVTRFHASWVG